MEEKPTIIYPDRPVEELNAVVSKLISVVPKLNQKQQLILLRTAEKMLTVEKRANIRKPCSIIVDYAFDNRAFVNYIKDISTKGLFIETQQPVKVGHIISMTFSLPGFEKSLKIKGEISRITTQGAGIKFIELSPYQEEMIGSIVERMES